MRGRHAGGRQDSHRRDRRRLESVPGERSDCALNRLGQIRRPRPDQAAQCAQRRVAPKRGVAKEIELARHVPRRHVRVGDRLLVLTGAIGGEHSLIDGPRMPLTTLELEQRDPPRRRTVATHQRGDLVSCVENGTSSDAGIGRDRQHREVLRGEGHVGGHHPGARALGDHCQVAWVLVPEHPLDHPLPRTAWSEALARGRDLERSSPTTPLSPVPRPGRCVYRGLCRAGIARSDRACCDRPTRRPAPSSACSRTRPHRADGGPTPRARRWRRRRSPSRRWRLHGRRRASHECPQHLERVVGRAPDRVLERAQVLAGCPHRTGGEEQPDPER